jgi:MFS superfamily sulfate permease-like transporter
VGVISFLLGFFRLGFIDVVLSRALLGGFIAAVAVVIMMYVLFFALSLLNSLLMHLSSEQIIPMLGLTALQQTYHPATTFDKIGFLLEHSWEGINFKTAVISFGALFALVALRWLKGPFKNVWWIYRIPEVLVVVVLSTSECKFF